jgi:hypothetical protein
MRPASKSTLFALLPMIALLATTAPAQFLINEIDADQAGTDTGEFVEIWDGGVGLSSLVGYCLVFYNGAATGDASYYAIDLTGATDALGYYLVGNALVVPAPAQVFPDNTLQQGADAVAIYFGAAAAFMCPPLTVGGPGISPTAVPGTHVLIDALVYDTADADDAALIAALTPLQPQIDEHQHGAALGVLESIFRCPDGAGGPFVTTSYVAGGPTPGAANVCPALYTISVSQAGGCGTPISVSVVNAAPFAEMFNFISLACVNPGSGPFFGLSIGPGSGDPLAQVTLPVGSAPFHVFADALGSYGIAFPVPPCTPVVMLTAQAVSVSVAAGSYTVTAISQPTTCSLLSW